MRVGMSAAVDNDPAVHQDVFDSGRILVRVLIRRVVDNSGCIEDRDVRGETGPEQTTIERFDLHGVGGSHFANRFLERKHMILSHVPAEHAREGTVAARMRKAAGQRSFCLQCCPV